MTNIEVKRAESGRIISISRSNSLGQNLTAFLVFSIISAGFFAELVKSNHDNWEVFAIVAMVVTGSVWISLIFARRIISREAGVIELGTPMGLRFLKYPELGFVKWEDIESFELKHEAILGQGDTQLVANLRNAPAHLSRLKSSNRAAPGKPYAPIFACVDTSRYSDLKTLHAVLDEARQQSCL